MCPMGRLAEDRLPLRIKQMKHLPAVRDMQINSEKQPIEEPGNNKCGCHNAQLSQEGEFIGFIAATGINAKQYGSIECQCQSHIHPMDNGNDIVMQQRATLPAGNIAPP